MTSSKKNKTKHHMQAIGMERIARAKLAHRVKLANLPFPEKVSIIAELQKIDISLAIAAGRKPKRAWKI
jgi:hypothetical protein